MYLNNYKLERKMTSKKEIHCTIKCISFFDAKFSNIGPFSYFKFVFNNRVITLNSYS